MIPGSLLINIYRILSVIYLLPITYQAGLCPATGAPDATGWPGNHPPHP